MTTPIKHVVIAGATSLIAQETARLLAVHEKSRFMLIARSEDKLSLLAEDLLARGATSVDVIAGDVIDDAFQEKMLTQSVMAFGHIDLFYIAWGELGDDKISQVNYAAALSVYTINFLSVVALLTRLVPFFESQKKGTIAVISSVAGDRGRQSNYVYGSSKAGLTAYLQGMRNRLYRSGVNVCTIKPGLIRTPMTAHLKSSLIISDAKPTARAIYKAFKARRDIAYVPAFWQVIMLIVCLIPESIFKRLKM